jgi:hypothetical protein
LEIEMSGRWRIPTPVPMKQRGVFRQFELEEILLPYFGANCVPSACSVGSALVEM